MPVEHFTSLSLIRIKKFNHFLFKFMLVKYKLKTWTRNSLTKE